MNFHDKFLLWRRYMAFLIDSLFSMATIFLICDLVFIKICGFENQRFISLIWGNAVIFVLITKDIFGISLGKRICRLKIVSWDEHKPPKVYQLIFRNIFILLLPIEAIFLVVGRHNLRIGDYLAETMVIPKNGEINK